MAQIPAFHDPDRVGTLFYPDAQNIAMDAVQAGLAPASEDQERVLLLLVDMQVDFCHRGGSLYVPGAEADIRRLISFLYVNAEHISQIACSLDSHYPFQIFHPSWWTDAQGRPPPPLTVITEREITEGIWRPVLEPDWSLTYVSKLREHAKKDLVIWPYHVPIGGAGNALDPELWSAVFWHSIARSSQPTLMTKGSIPGTEHYSILKPEVMADGEQRGDMSREFVRMLDDYDYVFVAGEAETHCVLETVEDLVELVGDDVAKLSRVYVLRDCMSPVVHPEIDFHSMAVDRFADLGRQGLRLVNSTDPLPFLK